MRKFTPLLLLLATPAMAQLKPVWVRTVSELPATCEAGRVYNVTDGASGTDCSTGSGSSAVWCICDSGGSSYTGADPAAGGGDVTDVGDCSTGACFTDAGAGNSLVFEGSTADTNELTLTAADPGSDVTLTLPAATDTLVGQATTDTLTNKTINTASNTITVVEADISDLSHTTDTNLSQEEVEDYAGSLVAAGTGTHTGVTVTYQDATGDVDFVVDDTTKLPLAGGTLTAEVTVDDLGLEFTAGDSLTDCSSFSSTGGGIFFDDSEGIFKKCQDNVLTDLDTGGGVGGSTGSTDNALLRADGTGGSTAQAGASATLGDNGDVVAQQIALPSGPFQSTQPTVMFGDGDSGFWETADDQVKVMLSGAAEWHWIGPEFRGHDANTPSLIAWAASATNPTVAPNRSDLDTGIGWASADSLALVSGGQTAIQMTESASVVTVTIDDVLELDPQSSPPVACASGTAGSMYSDDSPALCWCDGTSWQVVTGTSCS